MVERPGCTACGARRPEGLAAAGREVARLTAELDAARAVLAAEIRAAHERGVSERSIATYAQVARQTVRKALLQVTASDGDVLCVACDSLGHTSRPHTCGLDG